MSDNKENEITQSGGDSKDRVGDILRKERITRRITVETIAKDLKLNVKYIKALESSEYDNLPADPYIRVYLRSLAKYLSLPPDEILNKFYDERGLGSENYHKDISNKIEISMKEQENRPNLMLLVTGILIALLAGFTILANKKGWISTPDVATTAVTDSLSQADTTEPDSALEDSLYGGAPVQVADSAELAQQAVAATVVAAVDTAKMQVLLQVQKDSVWVQVFSDGQSWKNFIYQGKNRSFSARDSFNINVGDNSKIKYMFNGNNIKVKGQGVTMFKLDRTGPTLWTVSKWNSVFKTRQDQ